MVVTCCDVLLRIARYAQEYPKFYLKFNTGAFVFATFNFTKSFDIVMCVDNVPAEVSFAFHFDNRITENMLVYRIL